jgi:hypothetical protein
MLPVILTQNNEIISKVFKKFIYYFKTSIIELNVLNEYSIIKTDNFK